MLKIRIISLSMNKDLFTILEEMRQIQPSANYSKQSRFLILALDKTAAAGIAPFQNRLRLMDILTNFKYIRIALTILIFTVLISSGAIEIIYHINQSDQNDLMVKAGELNGSIQVKLNEIKYFIESGNSQINAENIVDIQILLDKTTAELKDALTSTQNNEDLKKSLEKIKAAQETLLQINSLLK